MEIIPNPVFAAVMTIPFGISFFATKFLIVDPMRRYLDERDSATVGAREEAAALDADTEAKLSQLEAELKSARNDASRKRTEYRDKALALEHEVVSTARAAAEARLGEALTEIQAESRGARDSVLGMAKTISSDIAGQVLGRSVQA